MRNAEFSHLDEEDHMTPALVPVITIALSIALALESKQMADGKQWTTENLKIDAAGSYCYGDAETNCARYGRLYTWEAAQRACQSLGAGWRLPTEEEWHGLAKQYGGLREESKDTGRAAYTQLLTGGSSGFNAVLGGNREEEGGQYARLDAHGFYWTASETEGNPAKAWFYNFGRGGQSLNRHREGDKRMAISVRCVKD
jgi:uncharacterized protein (TIGR02145 family)